MSEPPASGGAPPDWWTIEAYTVQGEWGISVIESGESYVILNSADSRRVARRLSAAGRRAASRIREQRRAILEALAVPWWTVSMPRHLDLDCRPLARRHHVRPRHFPMDLPALRPGWVRRLEGLGSFEKDQRVRIFLLNSGSSVQPDPESKRRYARPGRL